MNISDSIILNVLIALLIADFTVIAGIILQRLYRRRLSERENNTAELINELVTGGDVSERLRVDNIFFDKFIELRQVQEIIPSTQSGIEDYIRQAGMDSYYLKRLKSRFKYRRIEAAVYLGYLSGDKIRFALETALQQEKLYPVKLYMANALCIMHHPDSINILIDTLYNAPLWYQEKMHVLLFDFGVLFYKKVKALLASDADEIKKLVIGFSSLYAAEDLKDYLFRCVAKDDEDIQHDALKAIAKLYPLPLEEYDFFDKLSDKARNIVIDSLSSVATEDSMRNVLPFLKNDRSCPHAVFAISSMLTANAFLLNPLLDEFHAQKNILIKGGIAEVLSGRVEYFILKLLSKDKESASELIKTLLQQHKVNGIIGFLNKNKNIELENEVLHIVREVLLGDDYLEKEFGVSCSERLLKKLKLEVEVVSVKKKVPRRERGKIFFLYFLLSISILAFPILYICRYFPVDLTQGWTAHLQRYVIDFNYYLVYYSSAINLIYILILGFSFIGVFYQVRYWRLKKMSFLFKSNILPSISIIAPAYCEELNIVESINSLLNLRYPNYEVIVVNDGSTDMTLNNLIEYFKLEKVDFLIDEKIRTKPVRGVYKAKNIPFLTVIDKANGGKADSLNVGINISVNEYFCGIDADSLLEEDSLLKIVAETLDSEEDVVAAGGNIFPINSSDIDKGFLEKVRIPKNKIACLQTIEYIRAFMAGRIGWAYLNSLLIISGAFGLFKKKHIESIGGYLTEEGVFHRDTVGEDMELVVRLKRHLLEKNTPHRITYSYNANCWTEVPESLSVLYRQRDRWQRGLIDILSFHKGILFNPRHGRIGLFTMPYFFIFEFMGPLLETQGYLLVMAAAFLGLLNAKICMLLFISSIMLGTFVSLTSLFISEKQQHYFSLREIFILVFYSVIENFGFRQILSFWRVIAYFNSMKKPKGWGKMVRKGFGAKND